MLEVDQNRSCALAFQADEHEGIGCFHGLSNERLHHGIRIPRNRTLMQMLLLKHIKDNVILQV